MTADNTTPTTRETLAAIIMQHFHPSETGGSWRLNPNAAADAILAAFPVLGAVTGTPDTKKRGEDQELNDFINEDFQRWYTDELGDVLTEEQFEKLVSYTIVSIEDDREASGWGRGKP